MGACTRAARRRAKCVVPAECDTDHYQRWFAGQRDAAAACARVATLAPLGRRLTTPDGLASSIL